MCKLGKVYIDHFRADWNKSINNILDAADLIGAIKTKEKVLIKPNLVNTDPPPVTTPVGLVEAIVNYIKTKSPQVEVLVGDGTGSLDYETEYVFKSLGYRSMAERKKINLIDLNKSPYVTLSNPELKRWPEMHLPEVVMKSYLISVPVLKAHSLAGVTLSMKNMMGACPPKHYCKGGHWKKASFHSRIHEAIADLNRYRKPDFSIIDATVGLAEYHLGGPACDPPPNMIFASYDPVAADSYGCQLLKKNWNTVDYLAYVNGELGQSEPLQVIHV